MRSRNLLRTITPAARAAAEPGVVGLMACHQVVGFPGHAEMRAISPSEGDELARVGLMDRIARMNNRRTNTSKIAASPYCRVCQATACSGIR